MGSTKSRMRGVFWRANTNGSQQIRLGGGGKERGDWWVRYSCSYRHLHREKIGAKSRAQEEYFKRRTEVRRGKYCPNRAKGKGPILFKDAAREYFQWSKSCKRSWETDRYRLKWLLESFNGKTLGEITAQDVERFKTNMAKHRSTSTVNRCLATLKALFNRAIRDGQIQQNPVRLLKMFKENNQRVRYLTSSEEKALFSIIPEPYHSLCLVALHTGLRKGELLALKRGDIDPRAGIITVRRSKHGEARRVPMNSVVRAVLKKIPPRLDRPLIFSDCRNVSHRFVRWIKQAGIKDLHLHDLRHSFASRLAMAGEQLLTIKELMGHKTIAMTLRYSHLSPDHRQRAVERLAGYADEEPAQVILS